MIQAAAKVQGRWRSPREIRLRQQKIGRAPYRDDEHVRSSWRCIDQHCAALCRCVGHKVHLSRGGARLGPGSGSRRHNGEGTERVTKTHRYVAEAVLSPGELQELADKIGAIQSAAAGWPGSILVDSAS